jgi:hypothetical protein
MTTGEELHYRAQGSSGTCRASGQVGRVKGRRADLEGEAPVLGLRLLALERVLGPDALRVGELGLPGLDVAVQVGDELVLLVAHARPAPRRDTPHTRQGTFHFYSASAVRTIAGEIAPVCATRRRAGCHHVQELKHKYEYRYGRLLC